MAGGYAPTIGICLGLLHDLTNAEQVQAICAHAMEKGYRTKIYAAFVKFENIDNHAIGEQSVYDLIRWNELDAVIVMGETMNDDALIKRITDNAAAAGVPVITIDQAHEGCYNVIHGYDVAFETIVRHVFEEHHCTRVDFIAGMPNNAFSDARIDIYKKVLAENGLPFEERRLKYGYFWDMPAMDATRELLADEVPEAIICANDAMAIAACTALNEQGYRVPEDVILTGFDGIELERYHVPRMTNASQDLWEAGRTAIDIADRLVHGETLEQKEYLIEYGIHFTQSCGCEPTKYRSSSSQLQKMYMDLAANRVYEDMMYRMITVLTDEKTVDEMFEHMREYIMGQAVHNLKVCVNGKYLRIANAQIAEPYEDDDYFVVIDRTDQEYTHPYTKFRHKERMPGLDDMYERFNQVLFLPLHDQSEVFGYVALSYDIYYIDYSRLFSLMMSFGHSFNTVQNQAKLRRMNEELSETNKALEDMYIHDSMTGLLNRRGFFQEFQKQKNTHADYPRWLFIASIDMDSLKYINDTFGHQEGDFAIKSVANLIVQVAGEKAICARFGGDEYMAAIITANPTEDGCMTLGDRLVKALEEANQAINKPYSLGASCGTEMGRLTANIDIDDLMKKADDKMYTQKAKRKSLRNTSR